MGHADYSTTAIYAHYAPDASNGAALVERPFGSVEDRCFKLISSGGAPALTAKGAS